MSSEPPFLFVVGCGRSGTTLLRSMLDAHPDLAVPGESHFLSSMLRMRRRYERADGFDVDAFSAALAGHERFLRWTDRHELILDDVRRSRPTDLAEAVRSTYRSYASLHGASRWADKTPDYVRRMPALAALLPEARFVHMIRDGRAVAASLLGQPWGPAHAVTAARHWASRVRAGQAAGAVLGGDRYLEIRYEDLATDPRPVLEQVAAFGDLDFSPAMLQRTEAAARASAQVLARSSHVGLDRPVSADRAMDRWDGLDERDRRAVLDVVGPMLNGLGYANATGSRRMRPVAGVLAAAEWCGSVPRRGRAALRIIGGR